MSFPRPTRSQVRLWALCFAAFLAVGLSAGFITFRLALNQSASEARTDLQNTARLMALSVDAEAYENLRHTSDMRGDAYKRLADHLKRVQRQTGEIQNVYALRRQTDGSFVFVLGASTPSAHNVDAQVEKSYLLDAYPEVSPYAKRSYATGIASTEPNGADGKPWKAYAPILDDKGSVVGLLAAERSASAVEQTLAPVIHVGYIGLGLVVGLSLVLSLILVGVIERSARLEEAQTIDETDLLRERTEAREQNVMLQNALSDLQENFEEMVYALVKAVEAKDPYTAGHSERVMGYSVRIGAQLGLCPADLRILELGTLIHDVGKIGIPDHVLLKPGSLDEQEIAIIRAHPSIGAQMVERIPLFRPCLPIIRSHHERLNGQGYPDRLNHDDISISVRIAAVADAFDAMTSSRAYRGAMETERAIEELRAEAKAGGLDPEVVEALADIVGREGILWIPPLDQAA